MWLAMVVAAAAATTASVDSKPHIWMIVADDLGYGDLGYTGSSIKTPQIDSLAKTGVILGHYYVNICCSPTRSMLMTGRYNIRYGLQTQVIPNNKRYGLNLDEKTMAEYMNELGYTSHALGKWHLGLFSWPYTPTFRGFDSFYGYYSGSQDYFTHKDSGFDFHLDVGQNCGSNCSLPLLHLQDNYSTLLYAQRAADVIAKHDPTTPLFYYTAFQSVHEPIEAPMSYVEPYAHLDPNRRVFAGMLAALDEAVGDIAAALKGRGMWENTLTVFSTDNGGPVGSLNGHPHGIGGATGSQNWPLRGGKGAYFQGGVRGAAWVHGAMLAPSLVGTTTFELMHVTDLLPTFVAAAGGNHLASSPTGKPLDGVSQWKVLTEGKASPRDDVLINIERKDPTTAPPAPGSTAQGCVGQGQYVVIVGNHKLILGGGGLPNTWYHDDLPYKGPDPTPNGGCLAACNQTGCLVAPDVQVFDVLADEAERTNLADNKDLVAKLMVVVHKYNNSQYMDPLFFKFPVENPQECPFNKLVAGTPVLTPCE